MCLRHSDLKQCQKGVWSTDGFTEGHASRGATRALKYTELPEAFSRQGEGAAGGLAAVNFLVSDPLPQRSGHGLVMRCL